MDISKFLTELPAIGAIIFIVIKFLEHLKGQREAFTNTMNNHLEHNTSAIEDNTKAMTNLEATNKELCIYIKGLNGRKK